MSILVSMMELAEADKNGTPRPENHNNIKITVTDMTELSKDRLINMVNSCYKCQSEAMFKTRLLDILAGENSDTKIYELEVSVLKVVGIIGSEPGLRSFVYTDGTPTKEILDNIHAYIKEHELDEILDDYDDLGYDIAENVVFSRHSANRNNRNNRTYPDPKYVKFMKDNGLRVREHYEHSNLYYPINTYMPLYNAEKIYPENLGVQFDGGTVHFLLENGLYAALTGC